MNLKPSALLRGDALLDVGPGRSGVTRKKYEVDFHGGVIFG
jgi:hypothetical protein